MRKKENTFKIIVNDLYNNPKLHNLENYSQMFKNKQQITIRRLYASRIHEASYDQILKKVLSGYL
jgi:hypothetical protein